MGESGDNRSSHFFIRSLELRGESWSGFKRDSEEAAARGFFLRISVVKGSTRKMAQGNVRSGKGI